MSSEKRLLSFLAGLVSGAVFILLFARIKAWNSRKRLLKKIDAFAEPFEESFNEIIDSITVKYDEAKQALSRIIEQKKAKSIEIDRNIET